MKNGQVFIIGVFTCVLWTSAAYGITSTTLNPGGNWSAGGTWDNGVPGAADTAIINHPVTLNTPELADIISSNDTLTISGGTLTVGGGWEVGVEMRIDRRLGPPQLSVA